MIKVGVVGATGYSGLELVKLLHRHPETELSFIACTSRVSGKKISEIFPVMRDELDIVLEMTDIRKIIVSEVDCIFLATPNEASYELVPLILGTSGFVRKIIDLSGAFRLNDASQYSKYYGFTHEQQNILNEAVYGIPEFNAEYMSTARLVANPGCYPTSVILPLVPLIKSGLIDVSTKIIVDSKSGVSGAGRKPTENTHFVETNESFKSYCVHNHRHEPEMIQELSNLSGNEVKLTFTPHLLPINRGILSTIYAKLRTDITESDVYNSLCEQYKNTRFVRILPCRELPEIKYVSGTPYCDIGFSIRDDEIIIVSCIDNLLKGAASQAVQNYNLMFGFKEELGL